MTFVKVGIISVKDRCSFSGKTKIQIDDTEGCITHSSWHITLFRCYVRNNIQMKKSPLNFQRRKKKQNRLIATLNETKCTLREKDL